MSGRPPKPTVLKILGGETRPSRVNAREPKPGGDGSTPPAWLKGKGRAHWKRIHPLVLGMGVHTDADPDALALLCDALAEYIQARDVVRADGFTVSVTDGEGNVLMARARPEVKVYQDAWRRVNLMLQQFGLTPSSRAKVAGTKTQDADPFEELLNGRRSG